MERISRFRAILLLILFITILALFALKLFDLQIIKTNGNTDNIAKYTTVTTVRAARGDILDRNGNVLVGNRASYDLVFNHYVIESYGQTNEALYALVHKCRDLNLSYNDHFPVSKTRPFEYTLNDFATSWQNHFQSFMVDRSLDSDITAPLLIEKLRGRYKIPEGWSDEDARAVIGMRYEFDLRGISKLPTYTFIQDISDENLSAILELNIPGLMVESSTVREYHTKYGAHILGYMGGMDAADWEKYQKEGYSMDAYIGQSGFEEAFEEYLHGIDGQRVDVVSKDGTIVEQFWRVNQKTGEVYTPIAGNNVETTIDLELQGIAEDSLANIMKELTDPEKNTSKDESNGLDAEGAAVIVMKVKTGEILACASYPTYNLATMNQDWAEIEADPLKPFFNRAFGANYAPGSTFKMCTAVAALESGIITPSSIIQDRGIYTYYRDPQPMCWVYRQGGSTHGRINVTQAITVSCNYFFYEVGRLTGIRTLDSYASQFGLGQSTGIEIGDSSGVLASPEWADSHNQEWTDGQTITAAIGQSYNLFTPLQLANYIATLVGGGEHYQAHLLKNVKEYDNSRLLYVYDDEPLNTVEMSGSTVEAVTKGMHELTVSGGVAFAFRDCVVSAGAKTGSAQVGTDIANGVFVAYAPYEDPEIAVAIVIEKGGSGAALATAAVEIINSWFSHTDDGAAIGENTLLK